MQPLTAAPRDHLTEAQVRALLTGDDVTVTGGLDLLDDASRFVGDISDDLVGGSVSHDVRAASVHGTVRLQLQRTLAWGRDRVRPYVTLANDTIEARFNLGVYVLTTPVERRGEKPVTYDVQGYDLLHLLQATGPGDTYVVPLGTTYVDAIRAAIAEAGVQGAQLLLDGTRQDTPIPVTRVWALTQNAATWLTIVNDLLREIAYDPLWADENGNYRSGPYRPVETRPVGWVFDTADQATNLVHEDRTRTEDVWRAPNWWRFVRSNMDVTPVEGDGIYTVVNQSSGPTSVDELGRTVRKVVFLDAADQASLVEQGNRVIAEDRAVERSFDLSIEPLPVLGHGDVAHFIDEGVLDLIEVASWTVNLDGAPGSLALGTTGTSTPDRGEEQANATVTSAAPLRVVVDGATVASMANALNGTAYGVGTRLTVTVRNPAPPLVQGNET